MSNIAIAAGLVVYMVLGIIAWKDSGHRGASLSFENHVFNALFGLPLAVIMLLVLLPLRFRERRKP